MTLNRDLDGNIVPLGRVGGTRRRSLEEWFLPSADPPTLPSWLEADSGTLSGGGMSGQSLPAYARVTSAASNGAIARLRTVSLIGLQPYDEIILTAHGLRFDDFDGFTFGLRFGGTNQGAGLRHDPAGSATIRTFLASSEDTDIPFVVLASGGVTDRRRNISFRLQPKQKHAYVLMDGEEVAHAAVPNIAFGGGTRAEIFITNTEAVAHWFEVCGVTIDFIHN